MTNNILIVNGKAYRLMPSGISIPCKSCAFYGTLICCDEDFDGSPCVEVARMSHINFNQRRHYFVRDTSVKSYMEYGVLIDGKSYEKVDAYHPKGDSCCRCAFRNDTCCTQKLSPRLCHLIPKMLEPLGNNNSSYFTECEYYDGKKIE